MPLSIPSISLPTLAPLPPNSLSLPLSLPPPYMAQAQHHHHPSQHQHQHQHQAQQPYNYYNPSSSTQPYYPTFPQPYQNPPTSLSHSYPNTNCQISLPQEAPSHVLVGQPHQSSYYPQQQQQQQQQQPSYNVLSSGPNPTAAAAGIATLSQLTQFAGKMNAAERVMPGIQWQPSNQAFGQQHPLQHGPLNFRPPVGRPPYWGGGERGSGRFMGGRNNFGHHHPRPDGGAPPFRGRGRMGRGGAGRFSQPAPAAILSTHSESAPALEPASAPLPAPPPARKRRPPQFVWCDLCRVDCNTEEILEQHKNGKRHKKKMERIEQFQKYLSESQTKLTKQHENGQGGGENMVYAPENLTDASAPPENLPSAAAADENKMEMEQQTKTGEKSEISKVEETTEAPARNPLACSFENSRHARKRKPPKKFGRGGKRLRYSEVVSRSETSKEEPNYCDLCYVTCNTQAVFECHLAGKKHMSRVKQTQVQHGSNGAKGLHALYMPHALPLGLIPQDHNQQPIHSEGQDAAYRHQVPPVIDHQAQQVVTEPQALT